jgi:hypothetical protein
MNTDIRHRVIIRLHNAWRLGLLGSCIIAAVSPVAAFAQDLSSAEASQVRRLIQTWLDCSVCDNDESDPTLKPVIERGAAAIGSLGTALLDGPSAGDIELLRAHLRTSYKKLKDRPVTPGGFSPSRTQESFVKMYVDNYGAAYRIRAAQALGAIGAAQALGSIAVNQAKQALEEGKTQRNPRDDVDQAIDEALKKIH